MAILCGKLLEVFVGLGPSLQSTPKGVNALVGIPAGHGPAGVASQLRNLGLRNTNLYPFCDKGMAAVVMADVIQSKPVEESPELVDQVTSADIHISAFSWELLKN